MDQVCSNIDKIQNAVNGLVPGLEEVLLVLHWSEVNYSVDTVDSAGNGLEIVQRAELLFTVISVYFHQLANSLQGDLSIIFADNADIVLHEHSFKFREVMLSGGMFTWWLE